MKQIRSGVIGAGYWGSNLVRVAHEMGSLAAVCEARADVRDRVRGAYPGIATLDDVDAFLAQPLDAVIIAAPAEAHAELAQRAIRSGKHVFIEKPLALTVEDGEAVVRAAQARGVTAFVGHLLLYHPAIRELLRLIEDGAIGEVWHVRSRRLNLGKLRANENVWWSFAPHDVALVIALFHEAPLAARASHSERFANGISDFAYADYDFRGGRSAHIEVGWLNPEREARLDIFGGEGVLTFVDARAASRLSLTRCGARAGAIGLETWREDPQELAIPAGEPLRAELEAFFTAIESGAPAPTDGRAGVDVLRALTMADRAANITAFSARTFA